MKRDARGFSPIIVVVLLLVLVGIGFAGWRIYQANNNSSKTPTSFLTNIESDLSPKAVTASSTPAYYNCERTGGTTKGVDSAGYYTLQYCSKGGKTYTRPDSFSTDYINNIEKLNNDEKTYMLTVAKNNWDACLASTKNNMVGSFEIKSEYQGSYIYYSAACDDGASHIAVKSNGVWLDAAHWNGYLQCGSVTQYKIPKALLAAGNSTVTTCYDSNQREQPIPY
jgi:hypothetical protein